MVTSLDPERAARRRGARHGPTRSVRDCARRRCLLGACLPRKDRLYAIALDLLQSRQNAKPVRSTVRGGKTASLPETLTHGVHVRSGGTALHNGERRAEDMASERVKFTFPPDLVNTPVIYNMGKEFGVATNIRRANLSHDRGWVILEVVGTAEAIEKSLAWAKEQGVRIEPAAAETA